MNRLEKHKKFIYETLEHRFEVVTIESIRNLPRGIRFVTMAIGDDDGYNYSLTCKDLDGKLIKMVCQLSSFFSFFMTSAIFYIEHDSKYIRFYPYI